RSRARSNASEASSQRVRAAAYVTRRGRRRSTGDLLPGSSTYVTCQVTMWTKCHGAWHRPGPNGTRSGARSAGRERREGLARPAGPLCGERAGRPAARPRHPPATPGGGGAKGEHPEVPPHVYERTAFETDPA